MARTLDALYGNWLGWAALSVRDIGEIYASAAPAGGAGVSRAVTT